MSACLGHSVEIWPTCALHSEWASELNGQIASNKFVMVAMFWRDFQKESCFSREWMTFVKVLLREHVFSGGRKIGRKNYFGRNFDSKFRPKNFRGEKSTRNFGRRISGAKNRLALPSPEIFRPKFRVDFSPQKFFDRNFVSKFRAKFRPKKLFRPIFRPPEKTCSLIHHYT